MAGLMRRAGEYLGLVDSGDYEDPYDDGYGYPGSAPSASYDTQAQPYAAPAPPLATGGHVEPAYARPRPAAVPVAAPVAVAVAPAPQQITRITPKAYNDAKQIGEAFRAGVPVIMNLEGIDDVLARRLVDFAAGLTFGLRGSVERVTKGVFLLSPEGVQVSLDDGGVVEDGFFNQS